ncbi:MAG: hypothetical protein J2P36_19610 [Ktedonobacteraceae bacterium]|nr:hypothetical protein [Ktedonobacteraceae bacterium]
MAGDKPNESNEEPQHEQALDQNNLSRAAHLDNLRSDSHRDIIDQGVEKSLSEIDQALADYDESVLKPPHDDTQKASKPLRERDTNPGILSSADGFQPAPPAFPHDKLRSIEESIFQTNHEAIDPEPEAALEYGEKLPSYDLAKLEEMPEIQPEPTGLATRDNMAGKSAARELASEAEAYANLGVNEGVQTAEAAAKYISEASDWFTKTTEFYANLDYEAQAMLSQKEGPDREHITDDPDKVQMEGLKFLIMMNWSFPEKFGE